MTVRIVTDSTADISEKLAKEFGIGIVPLNIHFGNEVYKDGVDIWSDEFYHRLINEPVLPNTSQPSPGEFLKLYQEIAKPGDTIISIHISTEMSGTLSSARIASEILGNDYRVEIIDSRFVCLVLGMIVLRAAEMAREGKSPEDIINAIESWKEEIEVFFTVNSLEYLSRTGRIGKASAFLGGLLNIKPLLGIKDGVIVPIEKVRGNFQRVAEIMVDKFAERYANRPLEIFIVHTELPDLATVLRKLAETRLNITKLHIGIIGPVVGAHAGPNTVGIIGLPV